MPGIVVCGRRWRIASDDFVFSSIAEICLRTIWLIILAILVAAYLYGACLAKIHVKAYGLGTLAFLSLTISVTALLAILSAQGSVSNPRPRRFVSVLVIAKMAVFVIECGWNAYGSYVAFASDMTGCPAAVKGVYIGLVITGWIVLALLLVGIISVYDPLGRTNPSDPRRKKEEQNLWRSKLRCLCCCADVQDPHSLNSTYDDVSALVAAYFRGLDFVASDVSVGLILARREQKKRRSFDRTSSSSHSFVTRENHRPIPNWMTVSSAFQFVSFAIGIYGWPFFLLRYPCTGLCKIMAHSRCCCVKVDAIGDCCCGCTTSVILQDADINPKDIIYANFTNKIRVLPFYVAFDHRQRSVVVSIRGTLSLKDALLDMDADPEVIDVVGVPDARVHSGILLAARYIDTKLRDERILERAFSTQPTYDLVLTGHSLGAGAASILALFLRPAFPNLRCFAFSPPGWLFSSSLSKYSEDFICSVVVGDDLVPRLGLYTLEKLKTQTINAIASCDQPKYRILSSSSCCEPRRAGNRITEESNIGRVDTHEVTSEPPIRLLLPGRILFLEEVKQKRDSPGYRISWRSAESFDEILLSGTKMLTDHTPNVVFNALQSANQNSRN